MYRAVIADDEPKIIELIRKLGRFEEMGIEIIDECHDGVSALQSIIKNNPDLVISDIKMPEKDGLEMIEAARSEGCTSLFILISGYRHFEYARSAVSLNVVDYLLKPISEDQLNETLRKACAILEQNSVTSKEKEEYRVMKDRETSEKLERFWRDVQDGRGSRTYTENFQAVETMNQAYGFLFTEPCFKIVLITSGMRALDRTAAVFSSETQRIVRESFSSCASISFHPSRFGVDILVNFRKEKEKEVDEAVSVLYYGIRSLSEIYGDFNLNIGVSGRHETVTEMDTAMTEAFGALWARFTIHTSAVVHYGQVKDLKRINPNSIISEEEVRTASDCIKYLRREELASVFDDIYSRIPSFQDVYPADVTKAFSRLIDSSVKALPEEKRNDFTAYADTAFVESGSYSRLIKETYKRLDTFIVQEQERLQVKTKRPITEAVQYIRIHYAESLSQADVAEACSISTAYLSRLFKEEMQVGFQDFLTQVRIENAEKLLRETNLSIREIAAAVGYPDEKYFSKLYRKTTGIKPSEYRKLYG